MMSFCPDFRLPYADGVDVLVMPDTSTQLSAMRTGKLDMIHAVGWRDAASLEKTNPEAKK